MSNTTYDDIVYDSLPHVQGNIRFLETIADLFGVNPVDVNRCRVLELGTAIGKTIIPQAEELPQSVFLGIDFSKKQIDEGNRIISSLSLSNIELRCCDLMEIDQDWGMFDYIIAHGVFSWVPPKIQEKVLDICRTNLSPNGVAMISYNTYPGWHFKEYIRNLMLLHATRANSFDSIGTEIQQARAIVNYVAGMKRHQDTYQGHFLRFIRDHIRENENYYLYHEYLERENHPCYYLDFYRRLKDRGLDHLSDFDWTDMNVWMEENEIRQLMDKMEPGEISEQYLDFLVNRMFRSSIICRDSVPKSTTPRKDLVERYHLFVPQNVVISKGTDGVWTFNRPDVISLNVSGCKFDEAVATFLKQHGRKYFTLQQIWTEILRNAGSAQSEFSLSELKTILETFIRFGVLKIILHPVRETQGNPQKPYVRGFVRTLAKQNQAIPNPNFESNRLDPLSSFVVQQLDGRHAVPDIVAEIQRELRNGRISIQFRNEKISAENKEQITSIINESLAELQRFHLVVN